MSIACTIYVMVRQTSKWLKQMTVQIMLTPSLRKVKNFPFNPIFWPLFTDGVRFIVAEQCVAIRASVPIVEQKFVQQKDHDSRCCVTMSLVMRIAYLQGKRDIS
jgi:hypothetical protein